MGNRDKFQYNYLRNREIALINSDYKCVKCEEEYDEVHHVYGYEDNDPEFLRPLCLLCHKFAPMGDSYWEWENSEINPKRFYFIPVENELIKIYGNKERLNEICRKALKAIELSQEY
jgi:hypothetical protein